MSGEETRDKSLSRNDLILVMESYRNTIQMHTTLLEQQKAVITSQSELLSKQDEILSKQQKLCSNIDTITKDLESFINKTEQLNNGILAKYSELEKSITGQTGDISSKLDQSFINTIKNYASLRNRLYISFGGMIIIVISLVTLCATAFDKFELLNDMYGILLKIAEYFNIRY